MTAPLPSAVITVIAIIAASFVSAPLTTISTAVSAVVRLCFIQTESGHPLVDVFGDALAASLRPVTLIVVVVAATLATTARSGSGSRNAVIDLFARSSECTGSSDFLDAAAAAAGGTTAAIPATRLRSATVHEVVGSETGERRLDDMAFAMLVGVFVDETISTGSRDGSSENAFALGTGPFAGLFARAESFNGTSRQSSTRSLDHSLFATLTATTAAVAAAAATAAPRAR